MQRPSPPSQRPERPSQSTRSARLGLAALALVAALGCKRREAADAQTKVVDDPKIAVQTMTAAERSMPRYLRLTGTLAADEAADVAADVTGKILAVNVDRGSIVAKGAVLARTDARTAALASAEANAGLAVAKAQVAQAKVDCDRLEALAKAGAIAGADYDRAHAQCLVSDEGEKLAAARVASASKPLVDANIRAPFAGLVAERYVNTGEYLRPETKVVRLMAIDPIRLQLSVPEASVALVKEGQTVTFRVAAFDEPFAATVRYVGPSLRSSSRDLLVEAVCANPGHRLRPGMFATAQIALGEAPTVTIPKTALRMEDDKAHLFVVKSGRLEERLVELGDPKGDEVGVASGLAKGEQIINPVPAAAHDGARVE